MIKRLDEKIIWIYWDFLESCSAQWGSWLVKPKVWPLHKVTSRPSRCHSQMRCQVTSGNLPEPQSGIWVARIAASCCENTAAEKYWEVLRPSTLARFMESCMELITSAWSFLDSWAVRCSTRTTQCDIMAFPQIHLSVVSRGRKTNSIRNIMKCGHIS